VIGLVNPSVVALLWQFVASVTSIKLFAGIHLACSEGLQTSVLFRVFGEELVKLETSSNPRKWQGSVGHIALFNVSNVPDNKYKLIPLLNQSFQINWRNMCVVCGVWCCMLRIAWSIEVRTSGEGVRDVLT
jgi:hypothetical protein